MNFSSNSPILKFKKPFKFDYGIPEKSKIILRNTTMYYVHIEIIQELRDDDVITRLPRLQTQFN